MITETVDPATGLKFITVSGQVGTDANLEATTFQDQNILPAILWYDVPFDQSFPGGSANVAWRVNIFSHPPGDKQAIVSVRMQSTPNPGAKYSGITMTVYTDEPTNIGLAWLNYTFTYVPNP